MSCIVMEYITFHEIIMKCWIFLAFCCYCVTLTDGKWTIIFNSFIEKCLEI